MLLGANWLSIILPYVNVNRGKDMDMVRASFLRVLCGVLAVVSLFGLAGARADEAKITVVRRLTAGKALNFKYSAKGEVAGTEFQVERTERLVVKSVREDGSVVLERTLEEGVLTLDGNAQDVKTTLPVTETRDRSGKLTIFKSVEAQGDVYGPEIAHILSLMREPIIGAKEISAGDTWDTKLDNPASKDSKITIKTSFSGTEKVDDASLWKFKQSAEPVVNRDGSKMSCETLFWLNPKTGVTEKSVATIKDMPTVHGPMNIEIALKFVSLEDAKAATGSRKPTSSDNPPSDQ